jgi:hypothetical protein
MRPQTVLTSGRWLRPFGLALAAGLVVSACGSTAATPAPTPAPTPVPTKGPPTAQMTVTGDATAATLTANISIECDFPSFDGPEIVLFGTGATTGQALRVVLSSTSVSVRYAGGAGKTYVERDFTGTGVTTFDAAKGATFDSPLQTAPVSTATADLGALASIKGSVDCGNQTSGTSTVTVTGSTADGQLNGTMPNPVRVECDTSAKYGNSVQIIGIADVGGTPTQFVIDGTTSQLSVAQYPKGASTSLFYVGKIADGATVTLSPNGVHLSGVATQESAPAGTTAATVTVSGDATCGSTVVSPA